MANRLSVCVLTRDEERNLARAIRSVEGLADEVVVADTGSTDRTGEIARELGARFLPFAWDDDFAAGRNFAIAQATGDWVLWLNPDEELVMDRRDQVRGLIAADDEVFGYWAMIRSMPEADRPDLFSATTDLRLYRKRDDLRYVGRLHPRFSENLMRAVAGDGGQVRPSGLVLLHHAYMSVLDESKLRWAVRLLEKELRDRPGQLPYQIEYGRNLLMLGDPRGHDVLAEAIEQVLPGVDRPAPPDPAVQVLLEYVLNTPPAQNRGRMTAPQAADLAPRWFPDSPPLLWTLAERYFRDRQFAAAAVLLERLVHLGSIGAYNHSRGFDPRIVGPRALRNLGQCYRASGRVADARRVFQQLTRVPEFGDEAATILAELGGGASERA